MRQKSIKHPGELAVFGKARDLAQYTFNITNNTRRFPKKVRFTVTNRLQDKSIRIYECLLEANEIFPRNERDKYDRKRLQREVLTLCKEMLFLIDISLENNYIQTQSCEYWAKLVVNVKLMTAKWMKKDENK